MSIEWNDTLSAAAGIASAVAAFAALYAARQSNATAATLARIEHDRRHEERRPQLEVTLGGRGMQLSTLNVHLLGPDEIGHLDSITIRVDNDDQDHTILNPGAGLTQEEVDAHIWGPYRFTPGVDGADQYGRSIPSFPLTVGRGRSFQMERTHPGHWMEGMDQNRWQEVYQGTLVRLVISCRRGDDEWVLARTAPNPAW
ncbi:hypothetical protein [Streptomyces sp. NPDC088258]|uniref:hypothetical protein n=1 Tax=Streptomyces sp. NPDC088258 TaxID=3365849 RepID=UPI003818C707